MKKLLIVLFIFWGAIGLTACTGALYGRNGTALSDEDIANDRMTEIIEAIENKDQEKMKEILARNTISSVKDIEIQIENLLEYYKGEFVSYENVGGPTVYQNHDEGNSRIEFELSYVIITTSKTYQIAIQDVVMDDFDRDNEGVTYIYIKEIKEYNENQEAYWGDSEPKVGIYLR